MGQHGETVLPAESKALLGELAWATIALKLGLDIPKDVLCRCFDYPKSTKLTPNYSSYPPSFAEDGATFVTLERFGNLRGCIGILEAQSSLAQDVIDHAEAAAFKDPRFSPLSKPELLGLALHISVLTKPSPLAVRSESDLCSLLTPYQDGLILRSGWHRATFLPSVWKSLKQPQEFVQALKQKAGIPVKEWPDNMEVELYHTIEWSVDLPEWLHKYANQ